MLQTWHARRFERVLPQGRTRPMVVECCQFPGTMRPGQVPVPTQAGRFVVKALGLPEIDADKLCDEVFGNLVARELGVDTPQPVLVDLSTDFLLAHAEPLRREGLSPRAGLASGCEYFRGGFAPPNYRDQLTDDQLDPALRLYATDLIFHNPDRCRTNPNCGYLGDRIVAFDFEMMWGFRIPIIGQRNAPWEVANLPGTTEHIFYAALRTRKKELSWEPFLAALAALDEPRLRCLQAELPLPWRQRVEPVITHLGTLRDHLKDLSWELARSLA